MSDEIEDEVGEGAGDDFEEDFEGDLEADLEADLDDDLDLEDLEDDDFEKSDTDSYDVGSKYEAAIRANPKRASAMLQKRARVIEGVLDDAELENPEGAAKAWSLLKERANTEQLMKEYAISGTYAENDVLKHGKFGIGFVIAILSPTKVEVLFEDGIKRLACGK